MNKGLIFDIRHFTVHDGPGIRTTVFFKGCPLHCLWCHNPESQSPLEEEIEKIHSLEGKKFRKKESVGQWLTVKEVLEEVEKDRVFYDESIGGVTLSGGEPLFQPEFLYELLKELNKRMAIIMVSHDVGTITSYVKTIACVNRNLHYHRSNKITTEQLAAYDCPIQVITHGKIPHTVLLDHRKEGSL